MLVALAVLSIQGQNTSAAADTETDTEATGRKLAATVYRYFESSKSYHKGDLITRSQLAEMQSYLRKTNGHSPATHPRLLNRALADEARLVRYFYLEKNSEIL